jgi:hypothetical protein
MLTLFKGECALKILIGSIADDKDMSEAQTRFNIIDNVLVNCLGWDKENVVVEKYENKCFTDYELGKPRQAVLEAKREGIRKILLCSLRLCSHLLQKIMNYSNF